MKTNRSYGPKFNEFADRTGVQAARLMHLRYAEAGEGGEGENGGGEGSGQGGESQPTKTFTQAELDEIVSQRVRRESQKFADYDDLKSKATKYADWENSQKDANQKAIDAAVEATRDESRKEFQQERFKDRVLVAAAKDFADPEDAALALSGRYAEFLEKDGSVDKAAIDTELKALLKAKPYLAAKQTEDKEKPGSVDGGARKTTASEPSSPQERMRGAYASSK